MADCTLTLGDFTFIGAEVPESITIGGEQRLTLHELVGGQRVIDALGRADGALEWRGWLLGQEAERRARCLDHLRVEGKPLMLRWSAFAYRVLIRSFTADTQRFYKLPYQIACEVLEDLTRPITFVPLSSLWDLLKGDLKAIKGLVDLIRDKPLEGLFAGMKTAADVLQHGRMAFQSGLSAVLLPIARFQDRLEVLTREMEALTRMSIPLADILNGRPLDRAAGGLQRQAAATSRLPQLLQLSGLVGRLKANLEASASSPRQVTLAGGDLYELAAREYGDATAWETIAEANGLDDPIIHGVKTLTIPERPMNHSKAIS